MAGFGFSISDILLVSNLALDLYHSSKKAGSEFRSIATDVNSLRKHLNALSDELKKPASLVHRSSPRQQRQLEKLIQDCRLDLDELSILLSKYHSLQTTEPRARDKLRFTTGKQAEIKAKIDRHSDRLNRFLSSLQTGALERLEVNTENQILSFAEVMTKLQTIHQDILAGRRNPSILTDEASWVELEKELIDDDITEVDIEVNRDEIEGWLGRIRANGAMEGARMNTSDIDHDSGATTPVEINAGVGVNGTNARQRVNEKPRMPMGNPDVQLTAAYCNFSEDEGHNTAGNSTRHVGNIDINAVSPRTQKMPHQSPVTPNPRFKNRHTSHSGTRKSIPVIKETESYREQDESWNASNITTIGAQIPVEHGAYNVDFPSSSETDTPQTPGIHQIFSQNRPLVRFALWKAEDPPLSLQYYESFWPSPNTAPLFGLRGGSKPTSVRYSTQEDITVHTNLRPWEALCGWYRQFEMRAPSCDMHLGVYSRDPTLYSFDEEIAGVGWTQPGSVRLKVTVRFPAHYSEYQKTQLQSIFQEPLLNPTLSDHDITSIEANASHKQPDPYRRHIVEYYPIAEKVVVGSEHVSIPRARPIKPFNYSLEGVTQLLAFLTGVDSREPDEKSNKDLASCQEGASAKAENGELTEVVDIRVNEVRQDEQRPEQIKTISQNSSNVLISSRPQPLPTELNNS